MKNTKLLIVIALLCACLIVNVACKKDENNNTPTETTADAVTDATTEEISETEAEESLTAEVTTPADSEVASTEETSAEDTSGEATTTAEVTTAEITTDEVTTAQTSADTTNAPTESGSETSANVEETTTEEATTEETTTEEESVEETTTNKETVEETTTEETTTEETTTEETTTEEITTEEITTEETTPEETTTEEATEPASSEEETTTQKPEETTVKEIVVASKEEKTFNKTITVSGNTVTTKNGLKYTASGHSGVNGNKLVIGKNTLTVNFNDNFTDTFNKFVICYESTTPIKGTVTYLADGRWITDDFFLEAGTHTFSCLNTGYLEDQHAVNLKSMTFKAIVGSAEFALYDLETVDYQIFDSDTYYINSKVYKVGIKLSWGGGISYIRDKSKNGTGMTNLINQCDTGRLVQQSYYGTNGDANYTPGYYNNSKWSYNPVQGGDVAQNHSRIIDIVIEDYSVYVKSQPQDWAKDNQITPSYMENVYTVYEDRIQVDNRFVDFSYYNHHNRDQELPAFYTLSYLDTFVYYDGSKSWTGANLAYKTDLPFWGETDNAIRQNCLFPLRQSNTETWCAWVNQSINYGIGLYVPNVDFFLAGRFGYNGSKDSHDGATNYVAPLNRLTMVSGQPIEYSYLIATGSVEQMRDTFKSYKDFAKNESLRKNYESKRIPDEVTGGLKFDFTKSTGLGFLEDSNNANFSYDASYQAVKLSTRGADPHVRLMLGSFTETFVADSYKKVTIKYMVPTSSAVAGSGGFEIFLCAGTTTLPEAGKSVRGNYVSDGQWHEVTMDLSKLTYWTGKINFLRFDFFNNCGAGETIYVKSIEFHN